MKKLLLLILLSSQISAELMSLKCEYESSFGEKTLTFSNIFTFDKNQGKQADVDIYNVLGKLDKSLVGAPIIWSPSSITIKYEIDEMIGTVYHTAVISRENLSYQTTTENFNEFAGGKSLRFGQCKVIEVTSEKVF